MNVKNGHAAARSNGFAGLLPVDLRVDGQRAPLCLEGLTPRFSWGLEDHAHLSRQTAYRIRVFRVQGSQRTQVWDTGRVESDQTLGIAYAGETLESAREYAFCVQLWDANGATSHEVFSSFETGLLSEADWGAEWIGRTPLDAELAAPMFRGEFELPGKVATARAYVAGLGYFELHVNGRKIGDHHLDPAFTRFDRRVLYLTHDVTALLREGKNAVGAILGNGCYNTRPDAAWDFHRAPWRDLPKLRLELHVRLESGALVVFVSGTHFRTSTGPIVNDALYGGEVYDARLEKKGWSEPDFDVSDWRSAEVTRPPAGRLVAQAMPPIRITQSIVPVAVREPKPGVFVFDLGQNIAGHARLTASGPRGTEVVMRYGERLYADGTLDVEIIGQHLKKAEPPQPFQEDRYVKHSDGEETWEPRFTYHGFQYVEVTGLPVEPTRESVLGRFVHSDVESAGEFSCSDPVLNQLQENTRRSYLGNLHGIPTDCPHREKNGWTGDAHLATETGLYNFDAALVYRKWVKDLVDEQREDGAIPGIVPTSGWGYDWCNGPAWGSAICLVPWYLYEYSGDRSVLEESF
jgi:alpha-L-rhamnosidase